MKRILYLSLVIAPSILAMQPEKKEQPSFLSNNKNAVRMVTTVTLYSLFPGYVIPAGWEYELYRFGTVAAVDRLIDKVIPDKNNQ